ncbi:energy transducer TonB [Novosphingobium aerophilum]|uniref:energy transducer TonB n=1 Tax=Novosphingobium TaxID=165696 RepID=UPI002D779857|nr:TonB family protein [Novosphingobium sp. RL4]WRT93991.1 TonB family protein [Novosphingobium sp. RL4]
MISSRPLSLAMTGAVHAVVFALAWSAFGASQPVGAPGRGAGLVSFRAVDLSHRDEDRKETARKEEAQSEPPRPALAPPPKAELAAVAPARPQVVTVQPVAAPAIRLSQLALAASPAMPPAAPVSASSGEGAASGAASGEGAGRAQAAATASGGSRGEDTYARRVFTWIGRHKGYPGRIAREGREGTALVRLLIDEHGRLERAELARSSGHAALDALALEQIREAVPYPRPPRGLSSSQRGFLVPMTYRLDG